MLDYVARPPRIDLLFVLPEERRDDLVEHVLRSLHTTNTTVATKRERMSNTLATSSSRRCTL